MLKNLAQLKNHLVPGAEFEIVAHFRPECIGQIRRVNKANTTGIYSVIPSEPNCRTSTANFGKGTWLAWGKASYWEFEDGVATRYQDEREHTPEHLLIAIKLTGGKTA